MNHKNRIQRYARIAFVALLFSAQLMTSCLAFTLYSPALLPLRSHNSGRIALAASESTDITNASNENDKFENIAAAVVVPGFLTGADEFGPLCQALTEKGIPTVAVPMPNWHWLPCLGGRSARPILERIDFTVQHLVANLEADNNAVAAISKIPSYSYSLLDCWQDFRNNPGGALKVGGSSQVDDYPVVEPKGDFPRPRNFRSKNSQSKKKIALIGHRYVIFKPRITINCEVCSLPYLTLYALA